MKRSPEEPTAASATERYVDPAVRDRILRAQNGSDEACRELRAQYRPLLESSVARFASSDLTRQEHADLLEEADRILLDAISTYDCTQEAVNFGLYAKICLHNGLISEWRRIESRRRIILAPDAASEWIPDPTADPAGYLMEKEDFRTLCSTVRSHLSDFENSVWWPYVTGVSVADIARELGCDERRIHNALYRIRRKLRERIAVRDEKL